MEGAECFYGQACAYLFVDSVSHQFAAVMNSIVGLLISVVFTVGVLLAPWMLGGNVPPVRTVALGIMFLCSIACLLRPALAGTPTKLGIGFKCILLAGIAYVGLSLIPFGESALTSYPAATRSRLCELLLGISTCFVASVVFRNQKLLPWFFGFVALNGVLITFFGLAQNVSNTDKLFWVYELIHGGQPYGPFVNGNNAGGYLLLCFAAANFFLAQRVFRSQHVKSGNNNYGFETQQSSFQSAINSVGQAFANIEPRQMYMLAAVAMIAAGVLATFSRGAAVALILAIVCGWGLLFRRSLAFGAISLLVIAGGFGLLAWTQQGDAVVANLETLSDVESSSRNRIAHWKDAWQYASDNQPLGSGLGTYGVMYPSYQKTWHFKKWFQHAENQYLEAYAELGAPGLLLLLLAIGFVIIGSLRLLSMPDSNSRAVGLTGLIAIVSQMIAGAFDYGLYQPANTLLMAALVGAVFSQLNWNWGAQNVSQLNLAKGKARFAWGAMLLTTIFTGWATYEYSAVDATTAVRRFTERFDPARDRDSISRFQELGEYAISVRPDDSNAHYQLSLNHILQYRLAAADAMVEEMRKDREKLQSEIDQVTQLRLHRELQETISRVSMQTRLEPPPQEPLAFDDENFVEDEDEGGIVRIAERPLADSADQNNQNVTAETPVYQGNFSVETYRPAKPIGYVIDPNRQTPYRLANVPVVSSPSPSRPAQTSDKFQTNEQPQIVETPSALVAPPSSLTLEPEPVVEQSPRFTVEADPVPVPNSLAEQPIVGSAPVNSPATTMPQLTSETTVAPDTETAATATPQTRQQLQQLLQMLPEEFEFAQAWERTSLLSLHRLAWISKREGEDQLTELRSLPLVQKHLTKSWEHLLLAEQYCNKYWLTPMRLANLSLLMDHGDREKEYISEALARCPQNSDLIFRAALTKHNAGETDEAYELWNQCLNLTREYDELIIQICRHEVGIKAFLDQVLPTEPYFRIRLAKRYFKSSDDLMIKKLMMMHSKSKVGEHELPDGERNFVFAEMERISENYPVSLVHFKKALDSQNHRFDWRMQFARTLIAADMYDEAIAELKVCELYHGNHHVTCQKLIRMAKRLRLERFKKINQIKIGRS